MQRSRAAEKEKALKVSRQTRRVDHAVQMLEKQRKASG